MVHGFDAIKEVIDDLSAQNAKAANKTYHWFAIGNEDGEREFFFKPSNPTNSSFYKVPDPELQSRAVPVRKLDTLLEGGGHPQGRLFEGRRRRLRAGCIFRRKRATCGRRAGSRIRDQFFHQPNLS